MPPLSFLVFAVCGASLLSSALSQPPPIWIEGLDVSAADSKNLDLVKQAAAGARFVYIRCTVGQGAFAPQSAWVINPGDPSLQICGTLASEKFGWPPRKQDCSSGLTTSPCQQGRLGQNKRSSSCAAEADGSVSVRLSFAPPGTLVLSASRRGWLHPSWRRIPSLQTTQPVRSRSMVLWTAEEGIPSVRSIIVLPSPRASPESRFVCDAGGSKTSSRPTRRILGGLLSYMVGTRCSGGVFHRHREESSISAGLYCGLMGTESPMPAFSSRLCRHLGGQPACCSSLFVLTHARRAAIGSSGLGALATESPPIVSLTPHAPRRRLSPRRSRRPCGLKSPEHRSTIRRRRPQRTRSLLDTCAATWSASTEVILPRCGPSPWVLVRLRT